MAVSSQTAALEVASASNVSGVAWAAHAIQERLSAHVIAKVVMLAEGDGYVSFVAPEKPGAHLGMPAPEEMSQSGPGTNPGPRLLVRGVRQCGGRVVLRRGEVTIAASPFDPGTEPRDCELLDPADVLEGEWFVALGGDRPDARRWCKLPRLGVVAQVGDREPFVLRRQLVAVCLSSWRLAFVYRGSAPCDWGRPGDATRPPVVRLQVLPLADIRIAAAEEPPVASSPSPALAKPAPPVARIASNAEDVPAPADLEFFSNEATTAAEELSDRKP